jgi:hypothetical protein
MIRRKAAAATPRLNVRTLWEATCQSESPNPFVRVTISQSLFVETMAKSVMPNCAETAEVTGFPMRNFQSCRKSLTSVMICLMMKQKHPGDTVGLGTTEPFSRK